MRVGPAGPRNTESALVGLDAKVSEVSLGLALVLAPGHSVIPDASGVPWGLGQVYPLTDYLMNT